MMPSFNAFVTGFSTVWRVSSFLMRNTVSSGWPSASAVVKPVSDSATGFSWVMRPSLSVAMTPSPMLASVVRSRSACSAMTRSPLTTALPTAPLVTTAKTTPTITRIKAKPTMVCACCWAALLRALYDSRASTCISSSNNFFKPVRRTYNFVKSSGFTWRFSASSRAWPSFWNSCHKGAKRAAMSRCRSVVARRAYSFNCRAALAASSTAACRACGSPVWR